MSDQKSPETQYDHWDYYAKNTARKDNFWPGDEWGNEASWEWVFKKLFDDYSVSSWKNCVEIGCGAGKYSLKVLKASPESHIIAADISAGYQRHFINRMEEEGLLDRVTPVLIEADSGSLLKHIADKNWVGQVDALFSIDAMVHVDLQYLIAYWITAAHVLKKDGKLVMTVANACSDRGFEKLIADTKRMFSRMNTHSAKFEWISPEIVKTILPKLGFEINFLDANGRSILFTATLKAPLQDASMLSAIL